MPDLSLFTQKRELGVATLCVIWDILCAQAVSFYAVVGCIVSLLRNRGHKAPFICLFLRGWNLRIWAFRLLACAIGDIKRPHLSPFTQRRAGR